MVVRTSSPPRPAAGLVDQFEARGSGQAARLKGAFQKLPGCLGSLKLSLPWGAADTYMGLAIPQTAGTAAQAFGGVGVAMGAAHGVKAIYHLCCLGGRSDAGDVDGMVVQHNRVLGEVTTAAGLAASGLGAGILAAPVVLAGAVMTNLARAGAPEETATQTRSSGLANDAVLGAADTYLGWALGQAADSPVGWAGATPAEVMQGLGWFAIGAHGLKAVVHGVRAAWLVSGEGSSGIQKKAAWYHFSKLIGEAVKIGGLTAANCGVGGVAVPLVAIGSGLSLITEAGWKE